MTRKSTVSFPVSQACSQGMRVAARGRNNEVSQGREVEEGLHNPVTMGSEKKDRLQ